MKRNERKEGETRTKINTEEEKTTQSKRRKKEKGAGAA